MARKKKEVEVEVGVEVCDSCKGTGRISDIKSCEVCQGTGKK